jgi:hypothetical protein
MRQTGRFETFLYSKEVLAAFLKVGLVAHPVLRCRSCGNESIHGCSKNEH